LNEHHFIKTEGVKALIGVAVKDPYTQEALGILYLDYRQSHDFLRSDVLHAKSLASLAAVAVSNAHQIEELRQRKQLTVIRDIAETVGTGLDLEETMQSVLEKFHQVFENTRLCVLLYNKDLNALKFAPATLRYYKIEHPDYKDMNTFNLGSGTIACRVAKKTLLTKKVEFENIGNACEDRDYLGINYSTQSELCVSMLSKNDLLGVLVLERDQINAFEEDTVDLVKTVAQHLSIAIDRAQQSEELDFKSTVAAQTAWAADIAHEINNEVGQIRTWAYLIKNMAETGSDFQDYAQNIEDSAAVLSSVGPWSDQPERLVELDPALESVVHNYAIQKNVATEFWLEARDIFIKVNLMEFQHVFRQLVGNAARAMNTQHEKKIAIGSRQMDHRWVEITFRDCGPGITDELRLSLFQRRVKTKDKGGYGLLLARQMVEDMGGRIKILPYQKGCGAEFSIQFPIANSSTGFLEQDH
jgi:GAF domain-containing protein